MAPFSGKYTHKAGDRFVFKGGVTWPNAALPLYIATGGNAGNPDVYGVDPAWHAGAAAWTRPVFDAQGSVFTNHAGRHMGNVIQVRNVDYVTIDGIEIRNFVWNNPVDRNNADGWGILAWSADYVTATNCYVHDWVVRTDRDRRFGGIANVNASKHMVARNCVVRGPATIDPQYRSRGGTGPVTSGGGFVGTFELVGDCDISRVSQGVFGYFYEVRNNRLHQCCNSFQADTHENGMWIEGPARVHANHMYDMNDGEGVTVYLLPGWSGRSNLSQYFYNNILDIPGFAGNPVDVTNQGCDDVTNEIFLYNNIFRRGTALFLGTAKVGEPLKTVRVQNNLFITSTGNSIYIVDSLDDDVDDYRKSHNVVWTEAEAAAANLTSANAFKPQSVIGELKDAGLDLSAIFTIDFEGAARPTGAWDIGAYESGSAVPLPPAGFNLAPRP